MLMPNVVLGRTHSTVPTRLEFPRMQTTTLAGRSLALPEALEGQPAFLVVGFGPTAAADSERWLRWAAERFAGAGGLAIYLVAVVEGPRFLAPLIEGALRAASEPRFQPYAAVSYDPSRQIRARLGVHDANHAQAFLLDADGWACWQAADGFDPAAARAGEAIAQALIAEASERP